MEEIRVAYNPNQSGNALSDVNRAFYILCYIYNIERINREGIVRLVYEMMVSIDLWYWRGKK
jgi:hypothetical protein